MDREVASVLIDPKIRLLEEGSANGVLRVIVRPPDRRVVSRIRIYRIACLLGEKAVRQHHAELLSRVCRRARPKVIDGLRSSNQL
jgi:hypothetical protein